MDAYDMQTVFKRIVKIRTHVSGVDEIRSYRLCVYASKQYYQKRMW